MASPLIPRRQHEALTCESSLRKAPAWECRHWMWKRHLGNGPGVGIKVHQLGYTEQAFLSPHHQEFIFPFFLAFPFLFFSPRWCLNYCYNARFFLYTSIDAQRKIKRKKINTASSFYSMKIVLIRWSCKSIFTKVNRVLKQTYIWG